MRIYAYSRLDENSTENLNDFLDFLIEKGYDIPKNRLITEEVAADTSIFYRDKMINLVNYGLEENNILIIRGIDSLGSNFKEIQDFFNLIDSKKILLICLSYSNSIIKDDLKKIFIHFLKMGVEFESKFNKKKNIKNKNSKKVGRPEILNNDQKNDVFQKFKKGRTIYSLAKEFGVTRTVIKRILHIESEKISTNKL